MSQFMQAHLGFNADQAAQMIEAYYRRFGLTMTGLMREHAMAPEAFLTHMHDVDLSPIQPNAQLASMLAALPGRRIVFTNGCAQYAERICEKIGILDLFDAIFDIRQAAYQPKPQPLAYQHFMQQFEAKPSTTCFMDDLQVNVQGAINAGWFAAWIHPDSHCDAGAHWCAPKIVDFLAQVHEALGTHHAHH